MVWAGVTVGMLASIQLYIFATIVVQIIREHHVAQDNLLWLVVVVLTTLTIIAAENLLTR